MKSTMVCEGDLETIFKTIGITLTGDDYDKAQDLLQETCVCNVTDWIVRNYV
jgi:hypothetical protein